MSLQLTTILAALLLVFFAVVVLGLVTAAVLLVFRPWLQGFLSGSPVALFDIIGMLMRGSPVRKICEQRIKAGFVGVDLSCRQLELAYRQGVDIEKAVDALCLAKRTDREVCWDDLVATE
jgi:uncharacterized protein YqfA (UPF0365 family)